MADLFMATHEHRKKALATVDQMGDERASVLLLCDVLARLDRIIELLEVDNDGPS